MSYQKIKLNKSFSKKNIVFYLKHSKYAFNIIVIRINIFESVYMINCMNMIFLNSFKLNYANEET